MQRALYDDLAFTVLDPHLDTIDQLIFWYHLKQLCHCEGSKALPFVTSTSHHASHILPRDIMEWFFKVGSTCPLNISCGNDGCKTSLAIVASALFSISYPPGFVPRIGLCSWSNSICRSSGCHAVKLAPEFNSLGIGTVKLSHDLIWFGRVRLQITGYDADAFNL